MENIKEFKQKQADIFEGAKEAYMKELSKAGFLVTYYNEEYDSFTAKTVNPNKEFNGLLTLIEDEIYLSLTDVESKEESLIFIPDDFYNDPYSIEDKLLKVKYSTAIQRREKEEVKELIDNINNLSKNLTKKKWEFYKYLNDSADILGVLKELENTYKRTTGEEYKGFDNFKHVSDSFKLNAKAFIDKVDSL